jgi:hypothetical protein
MDGEGLATHVRPILGSKLWFIAVEEDQIPTREHGWPVDVRWQVIYLNTQDDL